MTCGLCCLCATFGRFRGFDRNLWIGLTRTDVSAPFQWVDGSPVTYTNFLPGQPDANDLGPELYVHMIRAGNAFGAAPGFWNDISSPNIHFPEFLPIQGVVEVVIIPISNPMMLLTSALAALGAARFRRQLDAPSVKKRDGLPDKDGDPA
jgi:hypothetical protein